MSAAKYTLGPWTASEAKHAGGEHVVAYLVDDREDCSLVIHAQQGDASQVDANAALIAAAPELLHAVKSTLWVLEAPQVNEINFCGSPKAIAKSIRKLIERIEPTAELKANEAAAMAALWGPRKPPGPSGSLS